MQAKQPQSAIVALLVQVVARLLLLVCLIIQLLFHGLAQPNRLGHDKQQQSPPPPAHNKIQAPSASQGIIEQNQLQCHRAHVFAVQEEAVRAQTTRLSSLVLQAMPHLALDHGAGHQLNLLSQMQTRDQGN